VTNDFISILTLEIFSNSIQFSVDSLWKRPSLVWWFSWTTASKNLVTWSFTRK